MPITSTRVLHVRIESDDYAALELETARLRQAGRKTLSLSDLVRAELQPLLRRARRNLGSRRILEGGD